MSASGLERKARPTNNDLQDQNFEIHDCLNAVGDRVDQMAETVKQDRHDSKNRDMALERRMSAMETRVARTEGGMEVLVRFFGLRMPEPEVSPDLPSATPRRRITLGSLEWWQALLGVAACVVTILAGWRFVIPPIAAGAQASYHAFKQAH